MKVRVIRVSGEEEEHEFPLVSGRRALEKIYELIDCKTIDVVTLTFHSGQPSLVMVVDDEGYAKEKPVNPKATQLYHQRCKPGVTHQIVGDVALVNDSVFA